MKTNKLIIVLMVYTLCIPLSLQTYSANDSLALTAIDNSCDASDNLNWNTEPDPGKWVGVTWNDENPKKIRELRVFSKSLTGTMDVKALTNLTHLDCSSNQLTGLDASTLTGLTTLSCYYNQIASLDVSELTSLTNLSCSVNQLTVLDVSK
jgi:Leucine-rich repeat (LRR) protein